MTDEEYTHFNDRMLRSLLNLYHTSLSRYREYVKNFQSLNTLEEVFYSKTIKNVDYQIKAEFTTSSPMLKVVFQHVVDHFGYSSFPRVLRTIVVDRHYKTNKYFLRIRPNELDYNTKYPNGYRYIFLNENPIKIFTSTHDTNLEKPKVIYEILQKYLIDGFFEDIEEYSLILEDTVFNWL